MGLGPAYCVECCTPYREVENESWRCPKCNTGESSKYYSLGLPQFALSGDFNWGKWGDSWFLISPTRPFLLAKVYLSDDRWWLEVLDKVQVAESYSTKHQAMLAAIYSIGGLKNYQNY